MAGLRSTALLGAVAGGAVALALVRLPTFSPFNNAEPRHPPAQPPATAGVVATPKPPRRAVSITLRASKVAQLLGDQDRQTGQPTASYTATRYGVKGGDLGVSFPHRGRTYFLFGDLEAQGSEASDAIAYTTDTAPDDGVRLDFVAQPGNARAFRPVRIPGVHMGGFSVPMEGVSVGKSMIIYHATNPREGDRRGRTVVAVSADNGRTFRRLYDLSARHFAHVSVVEPDSLPPTNPPSRPNDLLVFGAGAGHGRNPILARQSQAAVTSRRSIRYFARLDATSRPIWSPRMALARPLFEQNPGLGTFSVTYNRFIRKWIMTYNNFLHRGQRGILLRTANRPWGPWSKPQLIFDPWQDGGFCSFMHVDWRVQRCDAVHDPGRENDTGGEYGPFQVESLATGHGSQTTIYFTLSTWNPYNAMLMKVTLRKVS